MIDSLIDYVGYGAIVGLDGNPWIETPTFFPVNSELKELVKTFQSLTLKLLKGLEFQNERFMVVHQDHNMIVAQNQTGMLVLCKCAYCYVLSYLETGIIDENCLKATKDLAEWIENTPESEL
ncbi:profilin-like protein [Tritrichomonas musculus]|uniref:Profilin n=1 Tax=Tritrichomonas musculus TaxID=1915356 RepID=A0ABR2IJW6_9EUKA